MKSLMIGLMVYAFATQVFAANGSDRIGTAGQATLPAQIKVIDHKGHEVMYSTAGIESNEFYLSSDSSFSMGQTTMCDPGLGRLAEDLPLALTVTSRKESTDEIDPHTYEVRTKDIGPTGRAVLLLPKGTNVYGHCQSKTNTLVSVTFQVANEDGTNSFTTTFPLLWESARAKQIKP